MPDPRDPVTYAQFVELMARVAALEDAHAPAEPEPATETPAQLVADATAKLEQASAEDAAPAK